MTTVLYIPEKFAACDSKWTANELAIPGVKENKFVFFSSVSDRKMYVCFMCGDHIPIVISQALYLQLITFEEYTGLFTRYMDVFDLEYEFAIFELDTGAIKSGLHPYYPPLKSEGAHWMGSGGLAASSFFYHGNKIVRKKRRKSPPHHLSGKCKIAGALNFAYSKDVCSGGKVCKIEWNNGRCIDSSILPIPDNYSDNYSQTLVTTMGEIHEMYERIQRNHVVAPSKAANDTEHKSEERLAKAKSHSESQVTKMTMSRVIEQMRIFNSL